MAIEESKVVAIEESKVVAIEKPVAIKFKELGLSNDADLTIGAITSRHFAPYRSSHEIRSVQF